MFFLTVVFALFTAASCAYLLIVLFTSFQFSRERRSAGEKLAVRLADSNAVWPGISQIKPVRGPVSPEERACLRSFAEQDYPGCNQVVFAAAADPFPEGGVSGLGIKEDAGRGVELSLGASEGLNRKIASCIPAYASCTNDTIVLSDADMSASPHLMAGLAASLEENPEAGMATCLYTVKKMESWGAVCEGLSVNDFCASVLVARLVEGISFAMGAVMAVRRSCLEEIGGLEPLKDYLADDYQLGFRTFSAGHKILLSSEVVEDVVGPMSFCEYFSHQLRWMRTYRVSRPGGFFAFFITQGLFWSLAMLCAGGGAAWTLWLAAFWLLLRWFSAFVTWQMFAGTSSVGRFAFLAPVKDLFYIALWLAAFGGDTVEWGGLRCKVNKDGTVQECS